MYRKKFKFFKEILIIFCYYHIWMIMTSAISVGYIHMETKRLRDGE
ncbi:hypothetical protein B4110_0493 [Parageobacillus toebii]|uniref:Uncharacterized protein n=1 Tax=Parageobacillus toebii TaxID=153151 RepID=A0A150N5Q2_9BACL|nr:hypothetical protein B4110_0493 [Parageobacillus toebii]